jgi:hypothetical protein
MGNLYDFRWILYILKEIDLAIIFVYFLEFLINGKYLKLIFENNSSGGRGDEKHGVYLGIFYNGYDYSLVKNLLFYTILFTIALILYLLTFIFKLWNFVLLWKYLMS